MTTFATDADALEDHALLHQQIAQWYRDAIEHLSTHGQQVIRELEQWDENYATAYQTQWLQPHTNNLQALADEHDKWSQKLMDLAQRVRVAEGQLTGGNGSAGRHGLYAE